MTVEQEHRAPLLDWPRHPPAPRRPGLIGFARYVATHHLLHPRYLRAYLRYLRHKARWRGQLQTDGPCFIGRKVTFEIGKDAAVQLDRWSWVGDGSKLRCHGGRIRIGAKTVVGQETTFSAYESIELGRECIVADRSMFIDFDHAVMQIESPIRQQGLYTRPVKIGHNVWVGYGAAFLRGTTTGNNAVVGTYSVVTRDIPENAVAAGAPARVVRMRDAPQRMHWID